ncbi:MAG TPA: hypothetical protein VE397_21375 [Stellaceae bacterium]|jgi:hypothetical protein|nr:hypothetical protein [Stellaceae bacterium]
MSALSPNVERFLRRHVKSMWHLELLILLQRDRSRAWTIAELVQELRASTLVVTDSLISLTQAGCLVAMPADRYRYAPDSVAIAAAIDAVIEAYANFPVAVKKVIWEGFPSRMGLFADALRLKKR